MINEISVSEIQDIHYKRLKKRVTIFDSVLAKCYKVIKQAVSREDEYAVFEIPEIIFGVPLYKIPDCANYIYRNLRKNQFNVKYVFPNYLIIFWSYRKQDERNLLEYRRPEPEIPRIQERKSERNNIDILKRLPPQRKPVNNGRSVKEFRPSGNFLY
jgi:hypothetical protein